MIVKDEGKGEARSLWGKREGGLGCRRGAGFHMNGRSWNDRAGLEEKGLGAGTG